MEEFDETDQEKRKVTEVITFPVPLNLEVINVIFDTN